MNFISSGYQRFTGTFQGAASKEATSSTASTQSSLTTGEDQFDISGMPETLQVLSIPRSAIQIGQELGKGKFGTVYEGTWSFRKVAVKCYEGTTLSDKEAREIRHEVSIMQGLDHDCLVRFFGIVEEKGRPPMLVMEQGAKGSLFRYLHSDEDISWPHRLCMAEELARGLAYLHEKNIVHRDIKSLNIVLDKDHHAMWCDFGLAQLKLHSTITSKADASGGGSVAGTLNWMAPELFSRKSSTPSRMSDIWALGMVYFEIAGREIPYRDGQSQGQIIDWIKNGEGEEVPEECKTQAPDFGALMQRCWAAREGRPTAAQVAGEIGVLVEQLNFNKAHQVSVSALKEQKVVQSPPVPISVPIPALKKVIAPVPAPISAPVKAPAPIATPVQVSNSIPAQAFGKAQWAKYFGDIGLEPPLPGDIHTILNSPCPIFSGKKVGESHMLVLVPQTVNGSPLTLTALEELVKAPKQGQATQYSGYHSRVKKEQGDRPAVQSHWVLMTKDVIEGSRDMSYADQRRLVADIARRTGISYEVPHLLDATTCILMRYVSAGERLFTNSPYTFTRCQEFEKVNHSQITVGGFSLAGLNVYEYHYIDDECNGVAAVRFLR